MTERRTPDATLISALRILARDIQSGDGCANACLLETAQRLEELVEQRRWVPVGERLPEVGETLSNHWFDVAGKWGTDIGSYTGFGWQDPREFGIEVTHWRKRTPGPGGDA
jgi:hypothetical protein